MRVYKHRGGGQDAIAMVSRVRHGRRPRSWGEGAVDTTSVPVPSMPSVPSRGGVVVRVQDQCMTSEIFGSVKCDCKQQLDMSLALLAREARARWVVGSMSSSAAPPKSSGRGSGSASPHEDAATTATGSSAGSAIVAGEGSSDRGSELDDGRTEDDGGEEEEEDEEDGLSTDVGSRGAAAPAAAAAAAAAEADVDGEGIVGVVLYLLQEGRGVGLAAKVQAYALQEGEGEGDGGQEEGEGQHAHAGPHVRSHTHADDSPVAVSPSPSPSPSSSPATGTGRYARSGLDTVDANRALGLPDDVREYGAVVDILRDLRLVAGGDDTAGRPRPPPPPPPPPPRPPPPPPPNNPRKLEKMAELGVPLAGRIPCHTTPLSPLAASYMQTKAERMGHDIPSRVFTFPGGGQAATG
jgi:GTP cyclohydrolase II